MTSFCANRLVEAVQVREVGHVSLNADRAAADLSHGGVQNILSATGDEYLGPFRGEKLCCSECHSGATASNDRSLPS